MKDQLEIGLKFKRTVTSRFDFFSRGLPTECFKYSGRKSYRKTLIYYWQDIRPNDIKNVNKYTGIMSVTDLVSFNLNSSWREFLEIVSKALKDEVQTRREEGS